MSDLDERELLAIENLARTEALRLLGWARSAPPDRRRRALVFASRTAAGACAMALARHAANFGLSCRTVVCGPSHRILPAAAAQLRILSAMGLKIEDGVAPGDIVSLVASAGADEAIVDGTGDANAPGVEQEFAAAVRSESSPGAFVRLEPSIEYRTPRPEPGDVLFSPAAEPRTREDVRLMDSTAITRYSIPGLVLMENAGWRVAREAFAMLDFAPGKRRVLVAAGAGNNGGDGFVAARHLAGWGVAVEVVLVAARDRVLDDARANLELAEGAGVGLTEASFPEAVEPVLKEALRDVGLVIDALVGTGLSGKVRGSVATAIEIIAAARLPVLAVDTPSGLDANTGEILGAAIAARRTVTFAFPKQGFTLAQAPGLVGELVVADISLPRAIWVKQ